MTVTLLSKIGSAVELKLDAEALHVLSAAVEFTSRLNPRCRELAQAFEPLFRSAVPPQAQADDRLRLSPD